MTGLRRRMIEDRHMRDSARALVDADIANLRADLASRPIGARVAARIKDSAQDAADEAIAIAADNKGVIAAIVAACAVWLARNPILALLGVDEDEPQRETDD